MMDPRFESAVPLADSDIIEVEKSLGRKLQIDYVEFAKVYGGSFVGGTLAGFDGVEILHFFGGGEKRALGATLADHPDLRGEGILPIARCQLNNLFVLDRDGTVKYIDYYGGGGALKVGETFSEFVDRIVVSDEE